jgi:hypothetical protein
MTAGNGICGERPVPFLPGLIPTLERHSYLALFGEVCQHVLALSPTTADRLLRQPQGMATASQASS